MLAGICNFKSKKLISRNTLEVNCMNEIESLEEQLLTAAIEARATDIHLEPRDGEWSVRLRVQGVLSIYKIIDFDLGTSLLQRIKVKARMNISEKRMPLDGSYSYSDSLNQSFDLRVSSLPIIGGEKLTIRILYSDVKYTSLLQLGMNENEADEVMKWIDEPMGLFLITGPTGSGKTTTLYAIIQHLNTPEVHISTIEDPVEIRVKGVNQIQVSEAAGLTFAHGLRSLLRHDPDIIMIGEIRDREAAEIAIRASLTGHLVFATLHANDAVSAITRLLEMGIEPYVIAASLKGVISQKMKTHYCPHCHGQLDCDVCNGQKILNRSPEFELLKLSEEMTPYILNKRPPEDFRRYLLKRT